MSEVPKKGIVILGSTGSIGENALWVANRLRDEIEVVGLAAGRRWQRLAEQAEATGAKYVVLGDASLMPELKNAVPEDCAVTHGPEGMVEAVTQPEVDIVVSAITGVEGLRPVLAAIEAGKTIALASKEVLVAAGSIVMPKAAEHNVPILPVDSEHSALFQCMQGLRREDISRLILTASGGPFRESATEEIAAVTYKQALAHPTWNMGPKITVDSASLMNKALEIIEARWLFDVKPEQIEVVIHPQSIVHSLVETVDGGMLAQLGNPDMRLPIQYALTYPERRATGLPRCRLADLGQLEFEEPDHKRFPAIRLAKQALKAGGTAAAVLNAANEAAVTRFANEEIAFPDIWRLVAAALDAHRPVVQPTLEDILAADRWARNYAKTE